VRKYIEVSYMSEKRRGRPRDGRLDEIRVTLGEDVKTRMSLVNRRDMMEASRVLGLDTADGAKKFAYIANNGNLRKSVLTHLGRYIRRYRMNRRDAREFARLICKEKVRAKKVKEMLKTYRYLNSRYKMNSYDVIQLAWTICQGKLKLKQVEKMLRTYGMMPRTYGIEYIKEKYPEKFQEIKKGRKTISQVKQEIENETEYKEKEGVVVKYLINMGKREDFQASWKRLARLLWRPSLGNEVEITYKYSSLKEEEIEKLVKEGKLKPVGKDPQLFQVQDSSDELD
jgi:hypothetical protein